MIKTKPPASLHYPYPRRERKKTIDQPIHLLSTDGVPLAPPLLPSPTVTVCCNDTVEMSKGSFPPAPWAAAGVGRLSARACALLPALTVDVAAALLVIASEVAAATVLLVLVLVLVLGLGLGLLVVLGLGLALVLVLGGPDGGGGPLEEPRAKESGVVVAAAAEEPRAKESGVVVAAAAEEVVVGGG